MISLTVHPDGVILPVRAQPGARKNGVTGAHAGALKVAVSAAPEKGKANAAVATILAEAFGCKPSRIAIRSGETSREKTFLLAGIPLEVLRQRIDSLLADLSQSQ